MADSTSYSRSKDQHDRMEGWEMLEGVERADGSIMENSLERLAILGGWLVRYNYDTDLSHGGSITFVPDPNHDWSVVKR